jgi:hypothetical protein
MPRAISRRHAANVGLFGRTANDVAGGAGVASTPGACVSRRAAGRVASRPWVAVLLAGVAPGPAEMKRLTSGEVYLRIKAAVCAAQPGPDAGSQFDHRSGNVVDEGIQVLEQSLPVRTLLMGSSLVIDVNRRDSRRSPPTIPVGSSSPRVRSSQASRLSSRLRRRRPPMGACRELIGFRWRSSGTTFRAREGVADRADACGIPRAGLWVLTPGADASRQPISLGRSQSALASRGVQEKLVMNVRWALRFWVTSLVAVPIS